MADQILADLREHPDSTHADVSKRIGVSTYASLPVFQAMERHGTIERWRSDSGAIWRYSLGPEHEQLDVGDLERQLRGTP
jgi:hypothetical protein